MSIIRIPMSKSVGGVLTASLLWIFVTVTPGAASERVLWESIDPGGGGYLTEVAFSEAAPNLIFVGSDIGGVYRSVDRGRTWHTVLRGLNYYYIQDIAIDPQDPNNVYLATYKGIFKSTDMGIRWTRVFSHDERIPFGVITIDPMNPRIIYAGVGRLRVPYLDRRYPMDSFPHNPSEPWTGASLYRSTDSGLTWETRDGASPDIPMDTIVVSIVVNPDDTDNIFLSTTNGIYHTLDGGDTWTQSSAGITTPESCRELVMDPTDSDILYVAVQDYNGGGVFKSVDGGQSWFSASEGLDPDLRVFFHLVIDPTDPDVLYAGLRGGGIWSEAIFKTTDGAESWFCSSELHTTTDAGWIDNWDVRDVHGMAIDPNDPSMVLFTASGRLLGTEDGGETWRPFYSNRVSDTTWQGTGLSILWVHDIEVDATDPDRIHFAYADVGLMLSTDGGESFEPAHPMELGTECRKIDADRYENDVYYGLFGNWIPVTAADTSIVARSDDGAQTWASITGTGLPEPSLVHIHAMEQIARGTLIIGMEPRTNGEQSSGGLYMTRQALAPNPEWFPVNEGISEEHLLHCTPTSIVHVPGTRRIVAAFSIASSRHGGIYYSNDWGESWSPAPLLGDVDDKYMADITVVAASPSNPRVLYAGNSGLKIPGEFGAILRSVDGGMSWRVMNNRNLKISPAGLCPVAIHIDPQDPAVVYVGMNLPVAHPDYRSPGLLKSVNGGGNWKSLNYNLQFRNISAIEAVADGASGLIIGTSGNGAFRAVEVQQ